LSKTLKEATWRLILPEIRNIVKEEIASAVAPVNVRIDEMDKRLTGRIEEMDKRLTGRIEEMDKRLTGRIEEMDKRISTEIRDLRESVNVLQRVAVLEAQVRELRKQQQDS
jgi:hypothetical protein